MFLITRRLPEIVLSIFILLEDRYCYDRGQLNNTECNDNISSGSTKLNESYCNNNKDTMDDSEKDELWRVVLERSQLFITIIGKKESPFRLTGCSAKIQATNTP